MNLLLAEIDLLEVVKLCAAVLMIVITIAAVLWIMDWVSKRK